MYVVLFNTLYCFQTGTNHSHVMDKVERVPVPSVEELSRVRYISWAQWLKGVDIILCKIICSWRDKSTVFGLLSCSWSTISLRYVYMLRCTYVCLMLLQCLQYTSMSSDLGATVQRALDVTNDVDLVSHCQHTATFSILYNYKYAHSLYTNAHSA